MSELHVVDIEQLRNGVGCLDVDHCSATCKAAQVALSEAGHPVSVKCEVQDQGTPLFTVVLQWKEQEMPSANRSWKQLQRLGEWAAEGIAFLMIEEFTPFTVVEQAEIDSVQGGSGVDYYLGMKKGLDCSNDDDFPEHEARLEISGITRLSRGNTLQARVQQKIRQSMKSDDEGTPAYIIVIEFPTPVANFTERNSPNGRKSESQSER